MKQGGRAIRRVEAGTVAVHTGIAILLRRRNDGIVRGGSWNQLTAAIRRFIPFDVTVVMDG
jgi:hypothetical protein